MANVENDENWDVANSDSADDEAQSPTAYQISYYPADFTLSGYFSKVENGQIVIPDFQRAYIWDQVRASKLIESFLLGLPVPGVFLYKERETNKLVVIDGQQRIMTVHQFYKGRFGDNVFRLRKVQARWEGKTYDELTEAERFQLDDSVLRATVVQQLDPEDDSSIYHIFERLNTGGVNLNPMEIRKCVYHGAVFEEILRLNELGPWQRVIGRAAPDKRLRDAELVLRVAALSGSLENYDKPMKQFLNKFLAKERNTDSSGEKFKEEFSDKFETIVEKLDEQMGEKPFHLRNRLNYAFLDSFVASLIRNYEKIDSLNLPDLADSLLGNPDYIETASVSTSDEKTLKKRFELVQAAIDSQ